MVTLRRLLGVARLVFTVGSHGSAMTLLTPLCARVELRAVLVCLFVCFLACVLLIPCCYHHGDAGLVGCSVEHDAAVLLG